ncbi:MAG: carbohydrate kinase family protein [Lachnospiraceae bacterium]|nr:carbohydrate kinase family protein [Candidatus Equihabitans merdae]
MSITVIGSVFVDIKGYSVTPYLPTGRNVGRLEIVHGGVARNVAEDIANVELKPTFVGLIDTGDTGDAVLAKLKRHKVDTRFVRQLPNGMGTWLAVFDEKGQLAGSVSQRPDLRPIEDIIIENEKEIFSNASAIVLELDLEIEVCTRIFNLAEQYGLPVFTVISNMSIAMEHREFFSRMHCFVCNQQEAGQLFFENYDALTPEEMLKILPEKVHHLGVPRMVVTMGEQGAVYVDTIKNESGIVPAKNVQVMDTTGAGDAFFSGTTIGLTYGKSLREACQIGTTLAASVIMTTENVCPIFRPEEFGIEA